MRLKNCKLFIIFSACAMMSSIAQATGLDLPSVETVRQEMAEEGVPVPDHPGILNKIGYDILYFVGDTSTSKRYFIWNLVLFPKFSGELSDSLGDAYLEAGEGNRAIQAYRMSLEAPSGKSDNGREVIDRLSENPESLSPLKAASRALNGR